MTPSGFAERLGEAVAAKRSQVVVGLDPDPEDLLPSALEAAGAGSAAESEARRAWWP